MFFSDLTVCTPVYCVVLWPSPPKSATPVTPTTPIPESHKIHPTSTTSQWDH